MGNVIYLDKKRKFSLMRTHCIDCNVDWVSIFPVGTKRVECPNCSNMIITKDVSIPDIHWKCSCEGVLFYITPIGMVCSDCGNIPVVTYSED